MHGLVNRALEAFVSDTYGADTWAAVRDVSGAPPEGFETMFVYDDDITFRMFDAAAVVLSRSAETVAEDLGTYLVSHPRTGAVRRLLRFGGETFADFLHSIEDLPRRAALAVPDLDLPALTLEALRDGRFTIACGADGGGDRLFAHVLTGILRSMADDYGALVLLDQAEPDNGPARLTLVVLSTDFSEARPFQLAARG